MKSLTALLLLSASLFSALYLVPACPLPPAYGEEAVIAETGLGVLRFSDLKAWLEAHNLPLSILSDYDCLKKIVDRMIKDMVLREKTGSASLPTESAPPVDEQDIEAYYVQNRSLFHRKPQYRLFHILVEDGKKLEALIRRINALPSRTDLPYTTRAALIADFAQADRSLKQWGDLGWVSEGKFPRLVDREVFSLKNAGDYATFQSPLGYHFVMVMHVRDGKMYTLPEVRGYIRSILQRDREAGPCTTFAGDEQRASAVRVYPDRLREACLEEMKRQGMIGIGGGEMHVGFTPNEIEKRFALWTRHVRPFVDQNEPGWLKDAGQTGRRVRVKAFYIDTDEVTYGEYKEFLAYVGDGFMPDWIDLFVSGDDYPITGVRWHDADAYCAWKGKRLPTQDEWEFAARGAARRLYPWGDESPNGKRGNFADVNADVPWRNKRYNDGYRHLAPVRSYPKGATPEGIYDLGGNAKEWTASVDVKENTAVVKGGSFKNAFDDMMAADSKTYPLDTVDYTIGFRCACDAEDE